ncbi:MAG: IS66 family insertion sequence element accessory protein TnpB [Acinetobacter sp.]|nr:IS66 family insertion sequence element accessory protein TnpB [Acinetobacter sp.]
MFNPNAVVKNIVTLPSVENIVTLIARILMAYIFKRMDTAMAQVLRAFGYIKPHCAYLFCNKRGHRMKVLVHDGLGMWLCARRLEQGKFHWAKVHQGETVALSPEQLQAVIQGLPWQRIGRQQEVTML